MITIQSFASTRLISLIRVYILNDTKHDAKNVKTTLTVNPCTPREDKYVSFCALWNISSRSWNMVPVLIVDAVCGLGKLLKNDAYPGLDLDQIYPD